MEVCVTLDSFLQILVTGFATGASTSFGIWVIGHHVISRIDRDKNKEVKEKK